MLANAVGKKVAFSLAKKEQTKNMIAEVYKDYFPNKYNLEDFCSWRLTLYIKLKNSTKIQLNFGETGIRKKALTNILIERTEKEEDKECIEIIFKNSVGCVMTRNNVLENQIGKCCAFYAPLIIGFKTDQPTLSPLPVDTSGEK